MRIRTLTPLWTGGVDRTCDRLHETGIIGSLRWWYEAIVRGLGGEACDPSQGTCGFDAGLCDVCQLFGATGWRRRFRLEIVDDQTTPIWQPTDQMLNVRPPGRTRGWYLPPGGMGRLTLKFIGDPKVLSLMAALLLFLEKRGNLGAKPQLGYGVFAIENRDEALKWARRNNDAESGREWRVHGGKEPDKDLPDLRRFGFFKYQFETTKPGWWTQVPGLNRVSTQVQPIVSQYKIVPVSPALKNEWRFNRWNRKWGNDREIFGTLRPDRIRSKVAVSWAYRDNGKWEVRGWVWLKSPNWADRGWNILNDSQVWQTVLKLHGRIDTYRLISIQDVLEMLEETL
ncbi:MAG: type III-B CRISPR module RAMP protein Cmr1 [Deltaproteobacteria bacterium]|nr:type III-B CRISPR module RAMP protein Cmr1 [Deltaproteobacteria bacterium]